MLVAHERETTCGASEYNCDELKIEFDAEQAVCSFYMHNISTDWLAENSAIGGNAANGNNYFANIDDDEMKIVMFGYSAFIVAAASNL